MTFMLLFMPPLLFIYIKGADVPVETPGMTCFNIIAKALFDLLVPWLYITAAGVVEERKFFPQFKINICY